MSTNNNNKNVTLDGEVLWKQDIYGTDGDNRVLAGSIEWVADGQATAGAVPSKIVFKNSTAAGTLTEALVIDKTQTSTTVPKRSRVLSIPICGNAKVGTGAGWVITAGTNIAHATLPASASDATLVVPISGLYVGDTVTAVAACGQIEGGGNIASIVMSVRKLTDVAAAITDAELGVDELATDADVVVSASNLGVTGLSEIVAATESLYCLFTATTDTGTDIDLTHLLVTVTQAA